MSGFWIDLELEVIWGLWSEIKDARRKGEPWLDILQELAKSAVLLYTRLTQDQNSAAVGTRAHSTSDSGQRVASSEAAAQDPGASSEAGRRERS